MDLRRFEGKKVLITGAGGLIGRALVAELVNHNGEKPVEVIAAVRSVERAKRAFAGLSEDNIAYLEGDVRDLPLKDLGVEYIVHGASRTASRDFVTEPVEVILSAVEGAKRVLEFARKNPVKGLIYLSTMEVYGTPATDEKIYETSPSDLDTTSVRSSYPESKRLCECLCASYAAEYGVPAKIVRLTQTFGEGVDYNDGRVFAEFARCAIEGRDIILKTKGETKRNYVDIKDAANAVFTVLINGAVGEAYNVANEATYCSIYEMAEMVAREFGQGKITVRIEEDKDIDKLGYAKTLKMNLSTEKLRGLGWAPRNSLMVTYKKMIDYMRKHAER